MPQFEFDGQLIETKPGKTIIEAAYDNGLAVPHFCWHPDLPVAGNCRMCLVQVGMPARDRDGNYEYDENGNKKINFIPKMQIACASPVQDGMVVKSISDEAIESQEAVMEFLLINHPLDCPICDEAGECKLQEYSFKHSKGQSRFEEVKNHKPKRQVWGPNVVFDAERCISCSRCIRFAKEVAKQDVLTFVQRGDHVTIELFDGTTFDSPYSMNVIDICPVGALTSPDFRFEARVWELSSNESISHFDGTGTNINLGVRNNEILRITPRNNMYVNKYWLRDDARLSYDFVNKNRVTKPLINIDGIYEDVEWDEAIKFAANKLDNFKGDQIVFVASSRATNEDNYLFNKFANEVSKSSNVIYFSHLDESRKDDLLGVSDLTPNTKGVEELGINKNSNIKAEELATKLRNGEIRAMYVMEEDFEDYPEILDHLSNLSFLAVHSYNSNKRINSLADIILPASTFAEIEGTYTNLNGRVQHFTPALVTKENFRYMGMKMSRLDKFGADNDRWTNHEIRDSKQSWKIIQNIAKELGKDWNYTKSSQIFDEIVENYTNFNDMDYNKLDEYQGLVLGKGNNPDPKLVNYISHYLKPQQTQKVVKYKG
jgi:NADH-quinone oxidoreductase subunit G